MRSHPVPKVGDIVTLNDCGVEALFGDKEAAAHMKTLEMKITGVSGLSMTSPRETFPVEVDYEPINKHLIDHWHFDVVKEAIRRESPKKSILPAHDHICVYSRAIGQTSPRKCIKCGEPEDMNQIGHPITLEEIGVPVPLEMKTDYGDSW